MNRQEIEEIIEIYINGNISFVKNEVEAMSKADLMTLIAIWTEEMGKSIYDLKII